MAKEVFWTCSYCGENIGILDEETVTKRWFRNAIIDGKGRIDIVLHGDPLGDINPDNDPRKVQLEVELVGRNGTHINRDVCKDCLLQGKEHLDIGMPERTEDGEV